MGQYNTNKVDAAMSARLGKLRQMPVDLTSLRAKIDTEMERDARPLRISPWHRPLWRIAAIVMLTAGALGLTILSMLPREAMASVEQFAALHQDMQAGHAMMKPVSDMAAAERALKEQWSKAPDMPAGMPHEQMACCVHRVAGKKAAVVTLRSGNAPVTMAIADASEVTIPQSGLVQYNGREYSAGVARGVNMVMFERAGKSVCIMGNLPQAELLKLADAAKF